jgi:hypothetical protein
MGRHKVLILVFKLNMTEIGEEWGEGHTPKLWPRNLNWTHLEGLGVNGTSNNIKQIWYVGMDWTEMAKGKVQ